MLNKILGKLRGNLKSKKGFTLIELIVVIAIIAILIALIAPNVMKFVGDADKTAKEANAKSLYTAACTYQADLYVSSNSGSLGEDDLKNGKAIAGKLEAYLDAKTYDKIKTSEDGTYKITIKNGQVQSASWEGKTYGAKETVSTPST